MVVIRDLMNQLEYKFVQDAILKLYPREQKRVDEGYYLVLINELRSIDKCENLNHMTVHVQYVKEYEMVDNCIWNVFYSVDRRHHHQYSLQFASKEQIVSAFIDESDLELLSSEEYVAHVLCDIAREGQMEEQEDGITSVDPKNHLPHFT
ncbi:hypothetical protein NDS46_30200 (plasmid) [Paenibacillus thiaminolyticus]|uniref:DUF6557 family protein n=1 Tax=Paenibacillus thiaminolyticus TaxID=49283 RepID=UPI002330447A|nr:DUF6557 family protein [Paenibacillus thiaminolyticus]WCF11620.1 hypothetical protein NDS46_30200 [Paenibacillus thiaminolyticus]